MPANIYGNNVYSRGQKMWHNLGRVGDGDESALDVISKMELVEFELRPFSITLNGNPFEGKDFGIVRVSGSREALVGRTKGRYQITQPVRYAEIFDASVGKPVETLGFLGKDGDRMFITWSLPDMDIHGDVVETYGFLAVGFDGMLGEKLIVTNVRVVCQNTWGAALYGAKGDKREGRGEVYSGKHCYTSHEAVLASWMRFVQKDAEERVSMQAGLFRKMESTPVDADTAYGLFSKVYPYTGELGAYYPDDLRDGREANIAATNAKIDESRDLAMSLFQGAGIAITPTAWGVLNSVTEAENHHRKSKKDTAYSILLGNRHNIMENAMSVVSNYVNGADRNRLKK